MATNKDWYWDQFDVEQDAGEFDLSDEKTKILRETKGLTDTKIVEFETKFIDELYGTDERRTIIDGKNLELSRERWTATYYDDKAAIERGKVEEHWGLDLRRVDNEALKPGSDEHYLHLTRGDVNWASYEKDLNYQKAFELMKEEKFDGPDWSMSQFNKIDFLSDDDIATKDKVNWIRAASERIDAGIDKKSEEGAWRTEWSGKYDEDYISRDSDGNLFIDGERQETLTEKYAEGKGRLKIGYEATNSSGTRYTVADDGTVDPSAFDPISGPPTAVVKPDIRVNQPRVQIPTNIPASWKTHVKQTTTHKTVGGSK